MLSKEDKLRNTSPEPVGERIARYRLEQGWTQQALAARLAISRVAISHIESDLSIPGERTITLLAGIFKISPFELVEGTTYPQAKAERLPHVACCYTQLEMDLSLLRKDLEWIERLEGMEGLRRIAGEIYAKWTTCLANWAEACSDDRENERIACARKDLRAACFPAE